MKHLQFSEETVLSVSKTTLNSARENVTALSEFGVTDEMLNQFDSGIQAAEALSTEDYNRIELRGLTQDKDDSLDACYHWGRRLRARMQLAFGRDSSKFRSFPSSEFNVSAKSEKVMMPVMETLIKLAKKYQEQLASYGQTPEILAQGSDLITVLRSADAVQEIKKDDKRSATQERYQTFKGLYDTVNRINKIGRLVFENDPIKLALFESKWPTRTSPPAAEEA